MPHLLVEHASGCVHFLLLLVPPDKFKYACSTGAWLCGEADCCEVTLQQSVSLRCCCGGNARDSCLLSADRKKDQRTFVRLHSAPLPTVMIAMYVPLGSCKADKGDYFTRLSIMNKQDYVRWFSGELMIGTKTFDPSLRPAGHHEVCHPTLPGAFPEGMQGAHIMRDTVHLWEELFLCDPVQLHSRNT